jgi:hypothetical protein
MINGTTPVQEHEWTQEGPPLDLLQLVFVVLIKAQTSPPTTKKNQNNFHFFPFFFTIILYN